MRDSQRSAVYAWGEKVRRNFPQPCLGDEGAARLVRDICLREGRSSPSVCFHARGSRGTANYSPRNLIIVLPAPWAWTPLVVCHEVAHHLVGARGGWHGPEFTTKLVELWEKYAGIRKMDAMRLGVEQPRKVKFSTILPQGISCSTDPLASRNPSRFTSTILAVKRMVNGV